jgi:Ca2+-binding EF-hand superfamily protein
MSRRNVQLTKTTTTTTKKQVPHTHYETVEYRKIDFPKMEWPVPPSEIETPELSDELLDALKDQIDEIGEGKKINPHLIQDGLRQINFHTAEPEIYKIIEKLCLEYDINGKELSSDEIVDYIAKHLGDNKTRAGVNRIFEAMSDPDEKAVTPEKLHEIIEKIGDKLSDEDVQYLMQTIAEPSDDIVIDSDEFYYIMTKKPEEVIKINQVTKSNN